MCEKSGYGRKMRGSVRPGRVDGVRRSGYNRATMEIVGDHGLGRAERDARRDDELKTGGYEHGR